MPRSPIPGPPSPVPEGTAPPAPPFRYWAFVSYSHADKRWASWLHRGMETYRVPKALAGTVGRDGPLPRRAHPVFRDREELPTASNLGDALEQALADSRYLIVICSPKAARSRWVNEEVLHFKRLGRADRILCLIVDGEPNASDNPRTARRECFPPAIRFALGSDGELGDVRVEPIAADVRPGGDKKSDALLKLLAGVLGVGFDQLKRRDALRRQRRLLAATGASLGLAAVMVVLTISAMLARSEAERQRLAAELRLANFTSERGAVLYELGRFDEADESYRTASVLLDSLGRSTLEATFGRLSVHNARARPLFVHGEPFDDTQVLAVSPDGRSVLTTAAARDDYDLEIRDLATFRVERRLIGHTGPVSAASWSVDGRRILTSAGSASVGSALPGASIPGAQLLDATDAPSLRLWDADTGEQIRELFPLGPFFHVPGGPVALSPDARLAALAFQVRRRSPDRFLEGASLPPLGYAEVFDLDTMEPLYRVEASSDGSLEAVDFSRDGRFLTTRAQPGIVRVWDAAAGTLVKEAFGRDGRLIEPARRSPFLLTFGGGDPPAVHSLSGGAVPRAVYRGHRSAVSASGLVADGPVATLGSALHVWESQRAEVVYSVETPTGIDNLFTPDGRLILSWGRGPVTVTPAVQPLDVRQFGDGPNVPNAVSISDDGRLVATVGWNPWLRVFDLASAREVIRAPLEADSGANGVGLRFLPWADGYRLAVGDTQGSIAIYDLDASLGTAADELLPARRVPGPDGLSPSVFEVAGDGSVLVTQGLNQPMRVLSASLDELVAFNPDPEAEVIGSMAGASISPDGSRIAYSNGYGTAIHDTRTGARVDSLGPDVVSAFATAFSPDGRLLAAGGSQGIIVLFDLDGDSVVQQLGGHAADVFDLEFSPDGALLASGSSSLLVHDVDSGRELQGLDTFTRVVTDSEFTRDGGGLVVSTERSALVYFDMTRPAAYDRFSRSVPAAVSSLRERPTDGESLVVLADWYAFRGLFERAAEAYEEAVEHGGTVDPLSRARALWQAGRREDAHQVLSDIAGRRATPKDDALLALLLRATDPDRPEPGADPFGL